MKPMLACSTIPQIEALNYPVVASPKLDGIRCLIIDGKAVSRNLKPIPNEFVRKELEALNLPQLDGELMLVDAFLGLSDFNDAQSAFMSVAGKPNFKYVVFDSFMAPSQGYAERFRSVASFIKSKDFNGRVEVISNFMINTAADMEAYYAEFLRLGYEGAIVRDPQGPYKYGRSTMNQGWMLKLKVFNDAEASIVGVEELMHNCNEATTNALGATVRSHENAGKVPGDTLGALYCYYNGKTFKVGTGFDSEQRSRLWAMHKAGNLVGKFITFKYQEISKYGVPRFPVFKGIRNLGDM